MKSIGDQAKEFREAMGWSTKQMAWACHTSRQNIEALEKVGSRTPKYVAALAKVMNTTVDVLLEGRYSFEEGSYKFDPAHVPPIAFPEKRKPSSVPPSELAAAVAVLTAAIEAADEITRIQLEPLAAMWARKSGQSGLIAQRIVKLLSEAAPGQLSSDDRPPSKPGVDFEIDADGKLGNDGSSDIAGGEEERQRRARGAARGDAR